MVAAVTLRHNMKLRVSRVKIHLFAPIRFAFELEEKNERLETGSYIFAYSEREARERLLSASVVLAVSFWVFRKVCRVHL